MMKGDFYVVEYQFWDKTYTEIIQSDKLRSILPNSHVDKSMFFKFEIDVPEDVRE